MINEGPNPISGGEAFVSKPPVDINTAGTAADVRRFVEPVQVPGMLETTEYKKIGDIEKRAALLTWLDANNFPDVARHLRTRGKGTQDLTTESEAPVTPVATTQAEQPKISAEQKRETQTIATRLMRKFQGEMKQERLDALYRALEAAGRGEDVVILRNEVTAAQPVAEPETT